MDPREQAGNARLTEFHQGMLAVHQLELLVRRECRHEPAKKIS
jgi:hypothetical protein